MVIEKLETDREKTIAKLISKLDECRSNANMILAMEVAIRKGTKEAEVSKKYKHQFESSLKERNCECIMK